MVGPKPPVVMTISARRIELRMDSAIRSTLSPMVMVRNKFTPMPRKTRAIYRVFVSTISPRRISVPMVMISAEGIFFSVTESVGILKKNSKVSVRSVADFLKFYFNAKLHGMSIF